MKTFVIIMLLLFCCSPAQAHRLSVFAYEEQGRLHVESFFSGNRPARNCPVTLSSADNAKVVAQGKTDDQGKAAMALPTAGQDIEVVVDCGDGHRGQWLYQHEDAAGELESTSSQGAAINQPDQPLPANQLDEARFRKIIGQELDKQLGPIRRQLALNSSHQPSLTDILGGIGYLLGLAGLVAYFRNRRS